MSTVADFPASVERLYRETTGHGDASGRYASAAWLVPYNLLDPFLAVAGGTPQVFPLPWGGTVTRIVPLIFPDSVVPMYATSVEYDTFGFDASGATYAYARVRVHFQTFQYNFESGAPFITEQYDGATEYITQPGSAFKFPSDGRVLNTEVGVQVPSLDFALTFHRVPGPLDFGLYTSLQGRANSTVFVPGYYDLPAGTVLYLGPSGTILTDVGGVSSYQITHRFRFRWIPHNQVMRPDGSGFEAPVRVGDSSTGILLTGDLNSIFTA